MAIKITKEEFQERHARRLKGAIEDMRSGVQKITVAPTAQAADKQSKMKAHLIERIDDGTWAARLRKVSLDSWRTKMIDKGLPRVSGGIDAAKDKVVDFAGQLLPAVYAAQDKVKAMPDLTLEDSISRMTAMVREMAKFRKK